MWYCNDSWMTCHQWDLNRHDTPLPPPPHALHELIILIGSCIVLKPEVMGYIRSISRKLSSSVCGMANEYLIKPQPTTSCSSWATVMMFLQSYKGCKYIVLLRTAPTCTFFAKLLEHGLEILANYEYRTAPNVRTAPCPGVDYIYMIKGM